MAGRGALTAQLNARLGIEARYADQSGERRTAPPETVRGLWAALGPPGADATRPDTVEAALRGRQVELGIEPMTVARLVNGAAPEVPVHLEDDRGHLEWELTEEGGRVHGGSVAAGDLPLSDGAGASPSRRLGLPGLPPGYHRLTVMRPGRAAPAQGVVAVAPRRAYLPPCVQDDRRAWGLAVQLYGLRSSRNWGIGDFTDLADVAASAAEAGADVVGVNPLHALFPDDPERASPYSPSSRLFLNPFYLDVEAVPEFRECEEARALADASSGEIAAARDAQLVQYGAVVGMKRRVLEALYAWFRDHHLDRAGDPRAAAFRRFQTVQGEPLRRFAIFHALRESLAKGDAARRSPRQWPAEYQSPSAPGIAAFAAAHLREIEFFEYLQWEADRQLGAAMQSACDAGMGIGVYRDLAVGFDADGADAWMQQDIFVQGWSVGAPPDNWNPGGQSWGLLPPNPTGLRAAGYAPFLQMLRANMRHAGALRIDHILGLRRLFWIPAGASPAAGAYVNYPWQDLMALIALESHRARCLVVGEDLGTVPPGFREALADHGILSYWLFYFARDRRGGFIKPRRWPKDALAAVTTHDLPTLTGYWRGDDIELKSRLSLYPRPTQADEERQEREGAREKMIDALAAEKLRPSGNGTPIVEVHRFLARTPARLAMVQIEDMIELAEQVNVPGTTDAYPNWRPRLPRAIDDIFSDAIVRERLAAIDGERRAVKRPGQGLAPRATYRLQLNAGFTFDDAAAVLPYLKRLGISHVYASPILEAQKGSTHGYDTTSYDRLNPELGGEDGFRRFSDALRAQGLRLIVDFVPNHMGIGKAQNAWWLDLLARGEQSRSARIFDVDWQPPWPELQHCLLVPLLGDDLDAVLERGELKLRLDDDGPGVSFWYFDSRFPLREADWGEARRLIEQGVSAAAVRDLLGRQWFRLAEWRTASRQINYRRFFDINQLAGVRMEDPEVFRATHRLIGRLIADGRIHGLRLDHIDGLYDPAGYLERLRAFAERRAPAKDHRFAIVVEKILAEDESLPSGWPVDGTTGYEFVNLVNGVFVDPAGRAPLNRAYASFVGRRVTFDDLLYESKRYVIETMFGGELTALTARLERLAGGRFAGPALRAALIELAAAFDVYRTYVTASGASEDDRRVIAAAAERARGKVEPDLPAFVAESAAGEPASQETREFAARFQQFTAPIMAKSLEDTAFYRYHRLLSLNEVGGDPRQFGVTPSAFHRRLRANRKRWPASMLASATHDTKRGEDARARLNVLSEIPGEWSVRAKRWSQLTEDSRGTVDGKSAPSPEDEYLIYQTIVGAWPLADFRLEELRDRIAEYVVKATREAKTRTSWMQPNEAYEAACRTFVQRLFESSTLIDELRAFHALVAAPGALNGLGQTVLKLTAPGVPDLYRGCDLWDFSLVDPDNRRPVDFASRQRLLEEATTADIASLAASWTDGRIKLRMIAAILEARRHAPALFAQGSYEPLAATGPAARHVLAFRRRHKGEVLIVAVGRLLAKLPRASGALAPDLAAWTGTAIDKSGGASLTEVISGRAIAAEGGRLALAALFQDLPVAVLLGEVR